MQDIEGLRGKNEVESTGPKPTEKRRSEEDACCDLADNDWKPNSAEEEAYDPGACHDDNELQQQAAQRTTKVFLQYQPRAFRDGGGARTGRWWDLRQMVANMEYGRDTETA
jgi:hypothetical protein